MARYFLRVPLHALRQRERGGVRLGTDAKSQSEGLSGIRATGRELRNV